MNIIADAIGTNYTLQALEYQQNGDFQSAGFYFSQGIQKYQDALQSNPNNPSLLEHLAISQAGEVIVSTILKSGEVAFFIIHFQSLQLFSLSKSLSLSIQKPKVILGHWPSVRLEQKDVKVIQCDQIFLRAIDASPGDHFIFFSFDFFFK